MVFYIFRNRIVVKLTLFVMTYCTILDKIMLLCKWGAHGGLSLFRRVTVWIIRLLKPTAHLSDKWATVFYLQNKITWKLTSTYISLITIHYQMLTHDLQTCTSKFMRHIAFLVSIYDLKVHGVYSYAINNTTKRKGNKRRNICSSIGGAGCNCAHLLLLLF